MEEGVLWCGITIEGIRLASDWNMYHTLSDGHNSSNVVAGCDAYNEAMGLCIWLSLAWKLLLYGKGGGGGGIAHKSNT